MIVLSIETCSSLCGAALVRDGVLIGKFNINISNLHDEKLMGIIDNLLNACSLKIENIDGYAVSIGPGSFTGIRIGMSIAKGLAISNNKPLVGISTLDALSYKALDFSPFYNQGKICSAIDAKRDEAYYAIYSLNGKPERISDYDCKTLDELKKIIPEGTLFIGDAVSKIKSGFGEAGYFYSEGEINNNDPGIIAMIGYEKFLKNYKDDIEKLEPLYIKDFKPVTKIKGDL